MNKIAYLYVYDLDGFMPFAIEFSNEFEFYLEGSMLNVYQKPNYLKDVLGENIFDINIIAGENGVGKTTLIKIIAEILSDKDPYVSDPEYKYLALVQTGPNTLKVKTNEEDNGPFYFAYDQTRFDIEFEDSTLELDRPIIYYSPYLDFNFLEIYGRQGKYPVIDLGSSQIIIDDLEERYTEEETDDLSTMDIDQHPLIRHKMNNVKRHLAFMNAYRKNFSLPFDLPKELEIKFHRLSVESADVSHSGNTIFETLSSYAAEHFREYPENRLSKANMAKLMFLRNLLTLYFSAINNYKSAQILTHSFDAGIVSEIENFNNSDPRKLIKLIIKFFNTENVFATTLFDDLIDLVFDRVNSQNVHFSNSNNLFTLKISTKDPFIERIFKILNFKPKRQSREKHIVSSLSKFISFDWHNFSSGEKMFIDLFSRLYHVKDQLMNSKVPVLLLIDEGEMGFHPLWQIKYISTLRDFINEVFFDYTFQILMATHSPLVLSDFPSQRVHLFKKNRRGIRRKEDSMGTFAQSTSELLAHEFFIRTALIGNIAKEYIDRILKDIDEFQGKMTARRREELSDKISKINEPIIKKLLMGELERNSNA